jgi:osmoprotectant transport system permease protein
MKDRLNPSADIKANVERRTSNAERRMVFRGLRSRFGDERRKGFRAVGKLFDVRRSAFDVRRFLFLAIVLSFASVASARGPTVVIGCKVFPESAILQQIAAQTLKSAGINAVADRPLGGTTPNWAALQSGDIDVYPEYTGTIAEQIFNNPGRMTPDQIRAELGKSGIGMTGSIGFSDSYAIGMTGARASALGIKSISDLTRHPELKFAFSSEFLTRGDCWVGLRPAYGLPQTDVRGMLHALAYQAMLARNADATDLYSTDAEIAANHLTILADDRHFFPDYDAVYLYRLDLRERVPGAIAALEKLQGRINVGAMQAMNQRAVIDAVSPEAVAAQFLKPSAVDSTRGPWNPHVLLQYTLEHLLLVVTSLLMAAALGIPLGVIAAELPRVGQVVTAVVAGIYTIPSLALLVFMIPLLGVGRLPAIAALFLYSLLPIVRGTLTGLEGISPSLRESAEVLGLSRPARFWRVGLPLALPAILAGLKTAAVLDVGTATLGGFIGAGGYGEPIFNGINFGYNKSVILSGAVPAAVMALLAQWGFDLLERFVVPRGIRPR